MRLILGVDPAQKVSGYAYRIDEGPVSTGHFFGIENLGALDDLPAGDGIELFACIECPTWSGVGTRETRSAAIAWERFLQRKYANRRVWFTDPRQWQSLLLAGCPGESTKDRSLWYCAQMLKVDVSDAMIGAVDALIDMGLSVVRACERIGVNPRTYYWRKTRATQKKKAQADNLGPLSTSGDAATSAEQSTPSALGGEDRKRNKETKHVNYTRTKH